MTAGTEPDLAELLADGAGTIVLGQAATPTEARLIRERLAAAGAAGRTRIRPVGSGSISAP